MYLSRLAVQSIFLLILALTASPVIAQSQLPPDLIERIDKVVTDALERTGVPSYSIAVVKDGQIVYVKAYGEARVERKSPATPEMRYSLGSVSKQFTAAAILLLQEQGKLSLEDKVAKYFPSLTRANEVTIRQLLSHTAGYPEYLPWDYVAPMMLQPITAEKILDIWGHKPLDFEPGSKFQYSNTNYVIAGVIVEKVSHMPLFEFLREKVFTRLQMKSVINVDEQNLGESDPVGYMRYALGPLRPAPKVGKGLVFAAGELAMTAQDLAKWDISFINQSLLEPNSYRALATPVLLKNGLSTQYGLGIGVYSQLGHRALSHGGGVPGFGSQNVIFPDERGAVVVLTNQDNGGTLGTIASGIAGLLFDTNDPAAPAKLEQAKKIFEGLRMGTIDRALFTDNANAYFSEEALKDFASGLGPLGSPQSFTRDTQSLSFGMTLRVYTVRFPQKTLRVRTFEMPDGKLEQYWIVAQN